MDDPETVQLGSDAVGMTSRLGDLQALLGTGQCLMESAQLAERESACGARETRGKASLPEPLVDQFRWNPLDRGLGRSHRFVIVAAGEMGDGEIVRRSDLQSQIAEGFSDDPSATTQPQGLVELQGQSLTERRVHQHLPHATLISQSLGPPEGLRKVQPLAFQVSGHLKRGAKLDTNVDRILESLMALRQTIERLHRPLEIARGVPVRRSRERFAAGFPEVAGRLVPQIRGMGVVSEAFDVLPEAIPVECLDRASDPRVKFSTTILQQTAVRDLVCQRVLE